MGSRGQSNLDANPPRKDRPGCEYVAYGPDLLVGRRFRWLADDGSETDLMRMVGWKSPQMLRRYGASKADEQARDAHRRLGLGDKL